jgi:hypothetical protein
MADARTFGWVTCCAFGSSDFGLRSSLARRTLARDPGEEACARGRAEDADCAGIAVRQGIAIAGIDAKARRKP